MKLIFFLIIFGARLDKNNSARVAGKLIGLGYKDVKALNGGWKQWLTLGYPTEPK